MEDRTQRIRAFLFAYLRDPDLSAGTNIFVEGLVDSLFAVQLVMFVEREFAITVESDDLEIDNFCSIVAIDRFVGRKLEKSRT
jgi:acyl carrier protein